MTTTEKVEYNRQKHPIKSPCKCPRRCYEKISRKRREDIHFAFWSLSYVQRAMFLMGHVKRTGVQRKTVNSLSRRKFTMKYTMFNSKDVGVNVCKLFFLGTFGFQSDKVVTRLFMKNNVGALIPEDDMRGKHPPANKIDAQVVRDHIKFFCKHFATKPSKSKKLSVPPGITKMQMYNDFKTRNPNFKCGPSRYAQELKDMNVVLVQKKKPPPAAPAQPKQGNPTASSSAMVSSNQSGQYSNQQNLGRSNSSSYSYNNSGNSFPLSGSGTSSSPPSQSPVIMYSGHHQTNRLMIPPVSATHTPSWNPMDHQLYQQYGIGAGLGAGSQNPNKDLGQSFVDQMMMPSSASGFSSAIHDPRNETPQDSSRMAQTSGASNLSQAVSASLHRQSQHVPQSLDGTRPETAKQPSRRRAQSSSSSSTSSSSEQGNKPQVKRKRLKTEEQKVAYRRKKYPLLSPCKCPKKCFEKISMERREQINHQFWGLTYQMRAMFLLNNVKQCSVKRCTAGTVLSRRKFSRKYTMPDSMDNQVFVCKVFFLSTLGLTSDRMVTNLLHKNPMGTLIPADDNRGKHQNHPNKIDNSVILEHIRSHQVKVKGKLRLPADISAKVMYRDFKMKHSEFKCGLERYRQTVRVVRGKDSTTVRKPKV